MRKCSDAAPVILGIDPGTNLMGYALLTAEKRQPVMIALGVIELGKIENHYVRLRRIFERVSMLAEQYRPDALAIEAPFFGKNVQSMLKLGRAQGVAMAAALSRDIPIAEYAPLSIKQSVTGTGSASKESVAEMLKRTLNIPPDHMPHLLDATDALAAALTHFYMTGRPPIGKGPKSWKDFIAKNPDKIAPRLR